MTDNVTSLPKPGVVLDLDIEKRPAKDIKPPFVVNVEGRAITMADPTELNWQDLVAINAPGDLLRVAMSNEDRRFLQEINLPGWKFNRLLEAYYTHYDLEEKIRSAQRQANFGV